MEYSPFTVWFTGVSCSGKSTLADGLRRHLQPMGMHVELLDSGKIRRELDPDLGFTKQNVEHSMKRLAYECQLLNRNGVVAIVAAVSPFKNLRDQVRQHIGRFVEVFCDAQVDELIQRDSNNLLARAQRGEVANVAGVDAPYEPPDRAEVHLRTATMTVEESLAHILAALSLLQYIPEGRGGYTPDEEQMIKARLRDLGYI